MIVSLNPNNIKSCWYTERDCFSLLLVCHWATTQFYCGLWSAFVSSGWARPIEGHCNRLAVYPSGANPLNDILIAFLFILWNFNGLLSFYLQTGLSLLAPHITASYDIICQKLCPICHFEPINYECANGEREMATRVFQEKKKKDNQEWNRNEAKCS